MKMHLSIQPSHLYLLLSLIVNINGDCLYPEWKKTCQKYCMDHQLSEIQFNQCYSNHVKCQCNGQDLTEKIQNTLETTSSMPVTSISTTSETTNDTVSCIVNQSCVNGQRVCHTKYSFCICENEKWISKICPQGNICKKESTLVSCQLASIDDESDVSSSPSVYSLSKSTRFATVLIIMSSSLLMF